ncbi:hypothetical protein [Nocardia asiatica]|uniref:hypothetical protein n=1 Tax=Nocardia asiatica TaxID=209252 RepID=UPI002455AF68|nr:hypothetical protein [Nocardia asiatica]
MTEPTGSGRLTAAQMLAAGPDGRDVTGRVRPSALPKIRDQLARYLADPPYENPPPAVADLAAAAVSALSVAQLYWVTADMTALAMSAGAALSDLDVSMEERPAPAGLMLFDGGASATDLGHGLSAPIDAVLWGSRPGGLLLVALVARWRLRAGAAALGGEVDGLPPLMIAAAIEHDAGQRADSVPILAATVAAWHLMQQPTLADTWRETADKKTARALARAGREDLGVTVVDLRRLYRPTDPDHRPESGRSYSHRWVVTGHWRKQAHGPDRALRKRIWIPDYIKGPDGAPLLARERVNVWRR